MTWALTALRWLASSRVGQAVAAVLALLGVMAWRERKARQEGAQGVRDQAEKDYRDEAQKQAALDIGHGATDAERIRMLADIANRRGSGDTRRR